MSALPALARLVALLGVLLVPPAARAADTIYSYRDADGVVHFTNAPSDWRFKKIGRLASTTALYGKGKAEVLARPLPRGGSRDRYREHIRTAAERYKLPEALLLAVMAVESNFDHRAVSEKGAIGLMQLMPGTAREMFVRDALEPAENIDGGARYLRTLANQYDGDMVQDAGRLQRRAGGGAPRRRGGAEHPRDPRVRPQGRAALQRVQGGGVTRGAPRWRPRTTRPTTAFPSFLDRGSEALRGGDPAAAREALERALELRPKDAKALALLGQACYRQGRYDDASAAWQRLVNDNPVEPAARVNLGLAFLKAKRHAEARKQLEIALDFEPEHRKAMNYLGLALLESGSPVDAREWFRKAGSEQMVARCDDVIAGGWQTLPPPAAAERERGLRPGGAGAPAYALARARSRRPGGRRLTPPPPGRLDGRAAGALAPGGPFVVQDGVLVVAVRGERLRPRPGLLALRGRVALAGELKRFRGHATDSAFGEGAARMHRASGEGEILLRAPGRRFTALELGGDAAYLREEVVFGFEDGIAFENGRVASSSDAGLNLVHLRGRGRFLLATAGEPVALEVAPGAPLRVALAGAGRLDRRADAAGGAARRAGARSRRSPWWSSRARGGCSSIPRAAEAAA